MPSVLEIKDLRFGDGLGCPSPNRKYRDSNRGIIATRCRDWQHLKERPDRPDEAVHDAREQRAPVGGVRAVIVAAQRTRSSAVPSTDYPARALSPLGSSAWWPRA